MLDNYSAEALLASSECHPRRSANNCATVATVEDETGKPVALVQHGMFHFAIAIFDLNHPLAARIARDNGVSLGELVAAGLTTSESFPTAPPVALFATTGFSPMRHHQPAEYGDGWDYYMENFDYEQVTS